MKLVLSKERETGSFDHKLAMTESIKKNEGKRSQEREGLCCKLLKTWSAISYSDLQITISHRKSLFGVSVYEYLTQ